MQRRHGQRYDGNGQIVKTRHRRQIADYADYKGRASAFYFLRDEMTCNLNIRAVTIFSTFLLISLFSSAYVWADIAERYDENTEMTIKGTATDVLHERRKPVIVRLRCGDNIYNIVTAPSWYLSKESITFASGDVLIVTGSRYFSRHGVLYIIARQIKNTEIEKLFILRDSMYKPMWRGHRMHNRRLP